MHVYSLEKISLQAEFDLDLLRMNLQGMHLSPRQVLSLSLLWKDFLLSSQVWKVVGKEYNYLLLWLEKKVEECVDALWEESAYEGFLVNILAQSLCMKLICTLLPQVANYGCAAAPNFSQSLTSFLMSKGFALRTRSPAQLAYRYSIISYGVFTTCSACALQSSCSKKKS